MIKYTENRLRGGQRCDDLSGKVSLDKALHRFILHLSWKDTQLVAQNANILMIRSSSMGTIDTTTFDASIAEMRHLHQLAHIVFGLETAIPTHRVFRDHGLVGRIDSMQGPAENKAKAILACMAGVPDDIARALVARDYKLEEVCTAYALYVEDPSVSMLELLQWQYADA